MHYFRNSSGGMLAVTTKTNTLIAEKKPTTVVKPSKKLKNAAAFKSK